ncbi:MAG: chalcone isomerase family protein [Paraburkholderia sp.]|uniref:chalcone isomerase family protein n=1 Tax=Paraburkholderia sp. TaxID=1926495 RepID=UPI003C563A08
MRALAALLMLLCAMPANADWRADVQAAQLVGEGDFSVLGFRLYRAQLWSEHAPVNYGEPFALHLIYARDISRERFADIGMNEIERQAAAPIPQETLDRWRDDLMRGLTDVEPGGQLSAVFLPGKGVRFYAGERETAEIDDPAFARAFFGIWLDPSTRAPKLRMQLLGRTQ